MHSVLNRAQAVFGFFTTVALCVAGLAALSVLLLPADGVKADVKLQDVQVYVAWLLVFVVVVTIADGWQGKRKTSLLLESGRGVCEDPV